MTELIYNPTVSQTVALLTRYGFEMRGYTAQALMNKWLKTYQARWIRLAVVEALYQGRYKAISVEHILRLWFRRGNPSFHFTHEFEHLICRNLPRYFASTADASATRLNENDEFVSKHQEATEISTANPSLMNRETTWDWLTVAQAMAISDQEQTSNDGQSLSSSIADEVNSHRSASHRSIDQFTPSIDGSELYVKLKAVVQQNLDKHSE